MTYQPGDVANGYVLGDDYQWHPLPPAAAAPAAGPVAPITPPAPTEPAAPIEAAGSYSPVPYTPVAEPTPATTQLPQAFPQEPQPTYAQQQPFGQQGYPQQSYPQQGYPTAGQPSFQPYQGYSGATPPAAPTPKRPFYKKWWFWLLAVLLVVVIVIGFAIAALRSLGNAITSATTITSTVQASPKSTPATSKSPATTPSKSSTTTTTTTTPPPATGGTGQVGRDGDLQFTVTGVDCSKTSVGTPPLTKKATGVFCLVSITIANSGTTDADLNPFFQEATDSAGKTHFPDLAALVFMDDTDSFTDPIPAGGTATGVLPFDVQTGSTLTSIELHEAFNSAGAKISLP